MRLVRWLPRPTLRNVRRLAPRVRLEHVGSPSDSNTPRLNAAKADGNFLLTILHSDATLKAKRKISDCLLN